LKDLGENITWIVIKIRKIRKLSSSYQFYNYIISEMPTIQQLVVRNKIFVRLNKQVK